MKLEDMFPKTKFVEEYKKQHGDRKAITKQLTVVCGELLEVQEANARGDFTHSTEEILDVMHSTMQLFYMMGNYSEEEVQRQAALIREKNTKRGYYAR